MSNQNFKDIGLTRIFHPIGHGAFYSERIEVNDKKAYTMVYDCGSLTMVEPKKMSKTSKKTPAFFGKCTRFYKLLNADLDGNKVDILFISHFDADHVNGIKLLDPSVVILPFVDPNLKWVLQLIDIVSNGNTNTQVFLNPRSIFPNANILEVSEGAGEASPNQESRDLDELIDRNEESDFVAPPTESTINSGTPITLGGTAPFWEYVPWNPNLNKFLTKFVAELKTAKIDPDKLKNDIVTSNWTYVMGNIDTLAQVYNQVGNKNNHSLQVYSGPIAKEEDEEYFYNLYSISSLDCCHCRHPWCDRYCRVRMGCLYTGDIVVEDIWLNPYFSALGSKRLKLVGTIQIPHHGSKDNEGWKYADSFHQPLVGVICVEEKRRYCHPDPNTISKLLHNGVMVAIVTENVSTMLIERGDFTATV